MKLKSIYLLLVPALLSVSCSSDPEQSGSERIPIELHASGDGTVTTKADQTITESFPTTVFASMRDGDCTGLSASSAGYEWMKDTKVETNGTVSLPGDPAYPEDGSWIYLTAVSPQVSSSYQSAAGTVSYTLTGQDNLMYARQIKGNRWDGLRFSNNTNSVVTPLEYTHLLTQLTFKAKKKVNTGLTVKVKKISVTAPNSATLTLADGKTSFIGNSELSVTFPDGGTEISGTDDTDLTGNLLLPPQKPGDESYKITVETSIGTFKDLSISLASTGSSTSFAQGTSHEITLNIGDKELGISSVAVTEWTTVAQGSDLDLID